jgi:hypothetical protein
MGSSVFAGSVTGRPASPPTQAVYPGNGLGTAPKGWSGPSLYLVILVLLEAAALLSLRHGFRHHHGG